MRRSVVPVLNELIWYSTRSHMVAGNNGTLPEYVVSRDKNGLILRNFEGKEYIYPAREEEISG